MRDGLRNLYSVIKGADAHIRFALLTTERDLGTVFAPELSGLDRETIRRWYNGYNWTGATVYNFFDVLLLFQKRQFRPWWLGVVKSRL